MKQRRENDEAISAYVAKRRHDLQHLMMDKPQIRPHCWQI
jgi:hypothetical protein